MSPRTPKLYRFALYGRSSAGKTNLLAALAMPRARNPEGISCDWIPNPPGVIGKEAEEYARGRERMLEARQALQSGMNVPATAPFDGILRLRFQFGVVAPTPHDFTVEMIDYSGELIHDEHQKETGVGSLAAVLREHLRQVDGVFLLSEVPHPGQEQNQHREFHLLRQAFARLGQETRVKLHKPLAVILNKWDRRHPNSRDRQIREEQLARFLASQPEPAHLGLLDAVRSNVAEDCCRTFAASAFGFCQLPVSPTGVTADAAATTSERGGPTDAAVPNADPGHFDELPPLVTPLPSFGLEEPFVWAAQRRDALDLEELRTDFAGFAVATPRPPIFGLDLFRPDLAWRLWSRASRLCGRYRRGDDRARDIHRVRRTARTVFVSRSALLLLLVLGCVWFGEGVADGLRYRQVKDSTGRPERSVEQAQRDENWLEEFVNGHRYRHSFSRMWYGTSEAKQLLNDSRLNREQVAWAGVQAAASDLAREPLVIAYLHDFPNGSHGPEAEQIRERAAEERGRRANQQNCDEVAAEFERQKAGRAIDPTVLAALRDRLRQSPDPAHETRELFEKRTELADRIDRKLIETDHRGLVEKFRDALAKEDDPVAAARVLVNGGAPEALTTEFRQRLPSLVSRKTEEFAKNRQWADAVSFLDRVEKDGDVVGLLNRELIQQIQDVRKTLLDKHDRHLYEQVRTNKDIRSCRVYLENAPRKVMEKSVADEKAYLESLDKELNLTLKLAEIQWGNVCNGSTRYTIKVDGQEVLDGYVNAARESTSKDVATAEKPIRVRLRQTVRIEVRLKYFTYLGLINTEDSGGKEWDTNVVALANKGVELECKNKPATTIVIAFEGMPKEPSLPDYGAK